MTTVWRISPRDPMVAGDGGAVPALAVRAPNALPPLGTIAGFVRSALVSGQGQLSRAEAACLLNVRIRGPLLVSWDEERDTRGQVWVPAPRDVSGHADALVPGELCSLLSKEEGFTWAGQRLPYLVHVPSKRDGVKLSCPVRPRGWPSKVPALWPLAAAIAIALRDPAAAKAELASLSRTSPLRFEPRVHVARDDFSGTAEPMALWSSAGWRYDDDPARATSLLLEVDDAEGRMPPRLGVLGAEARPSRIRTAHSFPVFADHTKRYRLAVENVNAALFEKRRVFLRVQLITPGDFGGALPPNQEGLPLVAACVPGMQAASGWNMQTRAPRAVRRLAPAGSVYHFGPVPDPETLLARCADLWLRPLVPGQLDEKRLLAACGSDGYGLVLPGFSLFSREA